MSMEMGIAGTSYVWPFTNQNITFLPLSDPLCANDTCLAFAAAHAESQVLYSWAAQFLYGHYVSIYWCAFLAIFTTHYAKGLLRAYTAARAVCKTGTIRQGPSLMDKFVAIGRSISYRRLSGRVADMLKLPPLGIALWILLSFLFAILICFVEHPYYRVNYGYGSPPLGIRAGLGGVAMTPITIALSGKYNLVTLLTGVSHEKLNVLHRWCGMVYLFFGIVHTVPFIVTALQSGGSMRLGYQFYRPGSYEYTGIAPFAVLVFLCAFSSPWFRNAFYELFVHTHIAAAIAFLGTMFWHAGNSGDSWIYLWVTLAIWIIQLAARFWEMTTFFEWRRTDNRSWERAYWKRAGKADVQILDDDNYEATMMRILVKTAMTWAPGQHVFLRFPALGLLDNHPFTIASVAGWRPAFGLEEKAEGTNATSNSPTNILMFLIRPYNGLTKRLLAHARKQTDSGLETQRQPSLKPTVAIKATDTLHVVIDGPYGSVPQARAMHNLFDHVIMVAGGGGISAMLPWMLWLTSVMADTEKPCRLQRLSLIWCVRHQSAETWIKDDLQRCLHKAAAKLEIDVYVTSERERGSVSTIGSSSPGSASSESDIKDVESGTITVDGKQPANAISQGRFQRIRFHGDRPYFPEVLPIIVNEDRTMVLGCGPDSMKIDLSNTVARLQSKVMQGKAAEVALHTETFGW